MSPVLLSPILKSFGEDVIDQTGVNIHTFWYVSFKL